MKKEKVKNVLWAVLVYYSAGLSLILTVAGFFRSKSLEEIISVFLFLPITVFTVLIATKKIKDKVKKKQRKNKKDSNEKNN